MYPGMHGMHMKGGGGKGGMLMHGHSSSGMYGVMKGGHSGGKGNGHYLGNPMMGGRGGKGGKGPPQRSNRGNNDSVTFLKKLGSGSFASCYEAKYKGQLVAAKVTECPSGFRSEELNLLQRAQGEHVVRLIAVEEGTKEGQALIMEICPGNLEDALKSIPNKSGRGNERRYLDWLSQILYGLSELHGEGILFGDLKPENLLVREGGKVLYADFGDARDTKKRLQGSVHELPWGSPM